MELALYHPEFGYYLSAERKPGRGGDFLTSPEASPLFGITIARQIIECWERLDRPAGFSIREYGSGVGGLAYDILAGLADQAPELFATVRYRLVERNRHRQAEALTAFRDLGLIDHIIDESDATLEPITGVVLANEVADAFPAHRLDLRGGHFRRGVGRHRCNDGFRFELWTGLSRRRSRRRHAIDRTAALSRSRAGCTTFRRPRPPGSPGACRHLDRGYALVIDYGYEAPELYRGHRLAERCAATSGTLSPTTRCQRSAAGSDLPRRFHRAPPGGEAAGMTFAGLTTQGAFLAGLGLGDHLAAMQADPDTVMSEYLATQAVVMRLIDPGGLGRFRVLVMARDAPVEPPLRGFSVPRPRSDPAGRT